VGAASLLCAREARLGEYLTALWEQGVFRFVPPFWRMTAPAFLTHFGHFALAAGMTAVFAGTGLMLLRQRFRASPLSLQVVFAPAVHAGQPGRQQQRQQTLVHPVS